MSDFDKLCKSCMSSIGDLEICPKCGYNQSELQSDPFLKKGTVLEERYFIGKQLDQNCEGIGYIAYDDISKSTVYIREFFPLHKAARNGKKVEVIYDFEDNYNIYKQQFLRYFRTIAKFRNFSALVPIYDIFTANNTAYVVYEWVDGVTLNKFILRSGGLVSWDIAKPLFMPVISALSEMHRIGIGHYAISPENFIVTHFGKMKIVGFTIPEFSKANPSVPFHAHDGITALEQYEPSLKVTEKSDVYAIAACIFFALTGKYPQSAIKRKENDRLLIPTSLLKEIPSNVLSSLANALQVYPKDRTPSFEAFRTELSSVPSVKDMDEPQDSNNYKSKEMSKLALSTISFGITILVLVIVGMGFVFWKDFNSDLSSSSSPSEQSSTVEAASSSTPVKDGIEAPNLLGKNFDEIQKELDDSAKYTVLKSSDEFSNTVEAGNIISQVPEPGQEIEKDTAIIVTVSKGPKIIALPSVVGLTLSEASLKLSSMGFSPEEVKEYSDTIPSGYVIGYKNQHAGDKLEYGSKVSIAVSQGNAL